MKKIIMILFFIFVVKPVIGMDIQKKFIQAVMLGNLEALKDLEPKISGSDRSRALANALNIAIKRKDYSMTEYLLTIPDINVNAKATGITPIHAAVRVGDEGIVRLLLRTNKVDATIPSELTEATPLIDAVAQGNLGIVDLLLKQSNAKEAINHQDYPARFTALDYAYEISAIEGIAPERIPLIRKSMISALRGYGAETKEDLLTLNALNNLYQQLQLLNYQLNFLAQKMAAIK